jgi:hypothetical protein
VNTASIGKHRTIYAEDADCPGRLHQAMHGATKERMVMTMTDLISRADAIKAVNKEIYHSQTDRKTVVAVLSSLPSAEAVQEWIPCSERLPLVGGEFLVTLVDNDGTCVSTAQWNMTFGGRWQDIFPNDGYRDISNVIAWKTLPIPYREESEVKE